VTCREFAEFAMDYLAGELPPESRQVFLRHLSRCRNCGEYLRQYRDSVRAGRLAWSSPDEEVPADVPEDLVTAVMAALAKRSGPAGQRRQVPPPSGSGRACRS
jgi:anti-sigma factor RsiW